MVAALFADAKDSWNTMKAEERKNRIEAAVREILLCIGENPDRPGLVGTPDRVARMYSELYRGYTPESYPKVTTFENGVDGIHYDAMITDEGKFYSVCEHHMMPFFGRYVFAYIPNPYGKILGLSKIARLIDYHSAKLQIQERLVTEIVTDIERILGTENPPLGVALFMEGEHLCKTMRGAKKEGKMSCCYLTGVFKTEPTTRREFLNICK